MKKFLLGILCGFVFAGLAILILGFALIRAASKSAPETAGESFLVLRLDSEIVERPADENPIPWFDMQSPWTVLEIKQVLERAATDNKIKGLFLEGGRTSMGWAKAEELRMALLAFKKSGKPVHAFLRTPNAKDYFVATAADRVSMVDEDYLDLKGLRVERTYYKNTLDKLGIQVEVEHIGKYKDFGDSYTKTSMTPETRESMGAILDGIFNVMVQGIAEGRKRTPAEIERLMDDGPFLAKAALKEKLVDALSYEEGAMDELAKVANVSSKSRSSARDYRKQIRFRWDKNADQKIAYLVAEGDIIRGSASGGFGNSDSIIASRDFIKNVQALKNDSSYKAVLLRIDSGGGDAIASDELLAALQELSKAKPLVISMSDVAASGGYYMAVTGDPILAYPGTITGSIGVVFGKPNLKGLYDKIGLTKDGLQRGKNADLDSEYKPMSDTARKKLREGIEESYRTFVGKVAAGRKAQVEEIETLAQGRAWIASDPKAKRLTDQLGGIDAALAALYKKGNLTNTSQLRLVPYPPTQNALEKWFSEDKLVSTAFQSAFGGAFKLETPAYVDELRKGLRPALRQGGMLRWMPYTIDVK
ncbi:signal peptide peptidase SppA [Bryobacter aggregatus]|uniref:signal peptide peptidase SppA n=1 Tax=Bryobacter aggregatus TaxID=360054 RepID=UPI0004E17FEE|nr:signal peptide peptidase SppA [Bryobacter aggregatus]